MSYNSKNLSYEMKEPAFLRRLRQQHSGNGGPERYIAPRNRKAPTDDDEDAPTYVLGDGTNETMSRKEFEALATGDPKGGEGGNDAAEATKEGESPGGEGQAGKVGVKKRTKENLTDVGGEGGRKRKAVKIVGAGDDDDGKDNNGTAGKKKGRLGSKAKRPVTLSFGDDEA